MLNPKTPTVGQMLDWFFSNYEDPANTVPYETAEGGYQYFLGGPYDAREVLEGQFPNSDPDDLEEAISAIEDDGTEWVKVGQY
jgi:hypothetical protein